ncbi:MAG: RluA family pseudouridine synthase [Cytophagaceae bacterium]|nr:RluA family pseudouridine synthase [Cytophagaceae bacterium]MDW8455230.1 RluA family pseudouridine synthase [Cytophagaceae bacterium]
MNAHTAQEINDDELYEHYRIEVDKGQSPMRIDKFLLSRIENATRTKIQNAIESGAVKVNGKETKSGYKIKPGDLIIISLPHPPRTDVIVPENIPLDIMYEDEDLLVVNKPAGMVVHPAHENWSGTLVNALVYHFNNLPTHRNGDGKPGLVHRIDKDTSGLLVVAKTEFAMTHLAKQFFEHTIERTYYALVWGEPEPAKGTIREYIGRSMKDRRIMAVYKDGEHGKYAVTHYEVLKPLRYVSLVQCNLETGRTHQIRIHMKHIGHPLFNDEAYGGNQILKGTVFTKYRQFVENCFKRMPRQALHAKTLGFIHPKTKKQMHFDCPLPSDFAEVLDKWEKYVVNH